MGKYLFLWEVDPTKVPVNPKERELDLICYWRGLSKT
jgi:hypothetical protein